MQSEQLILVTGGCGFIGTNLTLKLLAAGARVRILDNFVGGEWSPVLRSAAEIMRGDIRDDVVVAAALRGVSKVVHLAAFGSVIASIRDPRANFDVNVAGTINLLQAAVAAKTSKFIFASTGGAAIGEHSGPVNEGVVPRPLSPYGAGKVAGEAYCHAFSKTLGLNAVSLRFANVYGPHSSHKTSAVTRFLKAARDDEPIEIYGDGLATRDFLYVDDLCEGITRALDTDVHPGSIFHLASGVETSVNQLLRTVLDVAGKAQHPVRHLPRRAGEVEKNFASFELAKKSLGFSPSVKLVEGIARTWKWMKDN